MDVDHLLEKKRINRIKVLWLVLGWVLIIGAVLYGRSSHAAPSISSGPTIPLVRIDVNGRTSLAPGAGYQVGLGWRLAHCPIVGPNVDCLHLDLGALGGLFNQDGGNPKGFTSLALYGCYGANYLCLGFGADIASSDGGMLSGFTWKRSTFGLVSIGYESILAVTTGRWNNSAP